VVDLDVQTPRPSSAAVWGVTVTNPRYSEQQP